MRRLLPLVLLVVVGSNIHAADPWTYGASEHFEVYTTGGARTARDALTYFERVYTFFTDILGQTPKLRNRTRLIVFSNDRQFAPYRPNALVEAFYLGSADRDYIVMKRLDEMSIPVVTHEYSHLILRHSGGTYPVWLNEGLAEVYSTMRPEAGRIRFGDPIGPYLTYLNGSATSMFELTRLFTIGLDSPEYNTRSHAGMLYAQSWALAHMLQFDERYTGKWEAFRGLVATGTASADALMQVYGQTPETAGRELRNYIARAQFLAKQTRDRYAVAGAATYQTRDVDAFEGALVTANLVASTRDGEMEARAAFQKLEAERPGDVPLLESRAYFELRRGRRESALPYFARAVEQGSRNVQLLHDYSRLDRSRAGTLLPQARALAPEDVDIRIDHAAWLLSEGQSGQVLLAMRDMKQVSREQAFRANQLLANAYLRLDRPDDARVAADRVRRYADTDAQTDFATRLHASIDEYAARRAKVPELPAPPAPNR